mmetsp:Transcript_1127/g.1975  ORF Transcript_1127/g.1975 Transcript_1127/m.1975 type:complete len:311 (-) Transcript_1127:156-1088(-)|eukprot:CAMPEP_0183734360 /NCGR_PEP_ID=MMETSP0737-20130205/43601_1 /TAXON_ID=385413 /ORGANISM="Thalassiosira miniscula, Strain CCMP1093" /LENGTH=310 /DNA_ID=CAMNT_0025967825 /DNA_START=179 /DNA_END=1111 /DNA_ORIENTATION=-
MAPIMLLFSILILLASRQVQVIAFDLSDRPTLKYGTAWKKDATADLVYKAIKSGFRHIDTACQPRHYNEGGVGEGWTKAARDMNLNREDLWIQTKFSGLNAHDPNNVPYDANAPLEDRVRQSLERSLENLRTDYLDSWIMHGPEDSWDDHWKVWKTMERAVDEGRVRQLGLSNFYRLEDIEWAYNHSRIKPKVVQNRFYADSGHDVEIREFCKEHDIEYQSFWTLTANNYSYHHAEALELAKEKRLTPEGLFYAFCMAIGISPMDGTTNEVHMKEDIELMNRIRSGEQIFANSEELSVIGNSLFVAEDEF